MYKLSQKESNTVNILRVVFTVMVVYIHMHVGAGEILSNDNLFYYIEYSLSEVICRCAVPGFFLISSIMLYRKPFTWKSNIKKKVNSILIPYILMNSFWIVFFLIAKRIGFISSFFTTDSSDIYSWNAFQWLDAFLGFDGFPVLGQTWFLRDLFVINLLAPFLKLLIDKTPNVFFIIISLLWFFNVKSPIFCLSVRTIFFFSLGYYIVKYNLHLLNIRIKYIITLISIYIFCVLVYTILITNNNISFLFSIILNGLYSITIIMGVAVFVIVAQLIIYPEKSKSFRLLLRYNFCIYLFHELTLTICRKAIIRLLGTNQYVHFCIYLILPIIVIVWCIVISHIMERKTPFLFNMITGSRKQVITNK